LPDVIVAAIMASLALQGAWIVLKQSRHELRAAASAVSPSEARGALPGTKTDA
jgi:Co/Zn/Cd efflux system component